ncbi:MAG: 50S ribosome-binding GTPase [Leptolyngbya sp. SIO1E4]|nr:50S ribosome-binding GTPase [Leptolyngbya sp. SIO1E4]
MTPRKGELYPPSVAVIGGTNVGKSTLTNALLGFDVASANQQAAYTRNVTGFVPNHLNPSTVLEGRSYAFWGFEHSVVVDKTHGEADQVYLRQLPASAQIQDSVLWDTPDVDSVAAQSHIHSVFEAASLAKVVLFVTTGQKYHDMAAVEVLERLLEMCIPVVVVFNQHTEPQEALAHELRHSLRTRLSDPQRILYLIDVHRIPRLRTGDALYDHANISILRHQIKCCLENIPDDRQNAGRAFISSHFDELLSPALERVQSVKEWEQAVKSAVAESVDAFSAIIPSSDAILNFDEASESLVSITMPAGVVAALTDADRKLINNISKTIATNKQRFNHSSFWNQLDKIWLSERRKLTSKLKTLAEAHERAIEQTILQTAEAMSDAIANESDLLKGFRNRLNTLAGDTSDDQRGVGGRLRQLIRPVTKRVDAGATRANIVLVTFNFNNELRSQLKSTGEERILRERVDRLIGYGQQALKDTGGLGPSDSDRITSLPSRIPVALAAPETESSGHSVDS